MNTDRSKDGPQNGVLRLSILCITFLVALDLVGAAVIRLNGYDLVVFGDISKYGIGILGGVLLDRALVHQQGR